MEIGSKRDCKEKEGLVLGGGGGALRQTEILLIGSRSMSTKNIRKKN